MRRTIASSFLENEDWMGELPGERRRGYSIPGGNWKNFQRKFQVYARDVDHVVLLPVWVKRLRKSWPSRQINGLFGEVKYLLSRDERIGYHGEISTPTSRVLTFRWGSDLHSFASPLFRISEDLCFVSSLNSSTRASLTHRLYSSL